MGHEASHDQSFLARRTPSLRVMLVDESFDLMAKLCEKATTSERFESRGRVLYVLESLNHNAPIPRCYKSSDCVIYTSVIHRILGYTLNDDKWVELSDQTRFRQPPSAAGAGQLHHHVARREC
jgi:hypothetical protein